MFSVLLKKIMKLIKVENECRSEESFVEHPLSLSRHKHHPQRQNLRWKVNS